jgi:FtsZ-binding cell division protein ZapB
MSDWRDPSEEDLGPQEFHRELKSKNKTNKKSLSMEKSQDLKNFISSYFWRYMIFLMLLYMIVQFFYLTQKIDHIQEENKLLQKQNDHIQKQNELLQKQNEVFQEEIEKIKLNLYELKK